MNPITRRSYQYSAPFGRYVRYHACPLHPPAVRRADPSRVLRLDIDSIFQIIRGMIRRGWILLNGKRLTGEIGRPKGDIQNFILRWCAAVGQALILDVPLCPSTPSRVIWPDGTG